MSERVPAVLSIAGSDSGGGAGIQADLKAFARCGVHGMTAIAALTAQNTVGVQAVPPVPPEFVREQIHSVVSDLRPAAGKSGMLGTRAIVLVVAAAIDAERWLAEHEHEHLGCGVVIDDRHRDVVHALPVQADRVERARVQPLDELRIGATLFRFDAGAAHAG